MQPDLIGLAGGWNRFNYVGGNALAFSDPNGLAAQAVAPVAMALPAVMVGYAISPGFRSLVNNTARQCFGAIERMFSEEAESANRFPNRELPRYPSGDAAPDPEAEGPYTQLGKREGRNGNYDKAREFDASGRPVRDIDFTDHGRPSNHPNPHQHDYLPNFTRGTQQRGPTRPLK